MKRTHWTKQTPFFNKTRDNFTHGHHLLNSIDSQYQNQIDYVLCGQRWKSCVQSAKTRPGADSGSDHQVLIAKFRFKLKKDGKTTRPARYDLNQIPYEYEVEVTKRFKGLELVSSVPEELWTKVCNTAEETMNKTIPKKKKSKKAKWLSEEASQIAKGRREVKSKGEKERCSQINADFQKTARRDKKAFFNEQCVKLEENNRRGKSKDLFRKMGDFKDLPKDACNKGHKW